MKVDRFIGLAAIYFYVLCWFVEQPEKWIWYIGVGLPWLSLIATIIIYFLFRPNVKDEDKFWGTVYVVMCIVYITATSIMTGDVMHQTPYLACCASLISLYALAHKKDSREDTN
jgi:peptidoglycan/LPS O-acetylase OafA/YrhL